MGNTTRRTPISFNIPKEPDYKFLNIAKFGGLYETDNPLTADYRTASDLLNVYVDEYDALTTRPRVAAVFDLYSAIDGEILHTYSLKNSLFIKVEKDNAIEMYYVEDLYSAGGRTPYLLSRNDITLNDKDFQVLEYKDTLFVLNDSNVGYIHWESPNYVLDTIDKWEGFPIPLTKERITPTTDGVVTGSKNVFTNQYRQSFDLINWQTAFVADEMRQTGATIYKNDYFKKILDDKSYLSLYDNGIFSYIENGYVVIGNCSNPEDVTVTTVAVDTSHIQNFDYSRINNRFVLTFYDSSTGSCTASVYEILGNSNYYCSKTDITLTETFNTYVKMSYSGDKILFANYYTEKLELATLTNQNYVVAYINSPWYYSGSGVSDSYHYSLFDYDDNLLFLIPEDDFSEFSILKYDPDVTGEYTTLYTSSSQYSLIHGQPKYRILQDNNCFMISKNKTIVVNYVNDSEGYDGCLVLTNNAGIYEEQFTRKYTYVSGISSDGNVIFRGSELNNRMYINGSFKTRLDDGEIPYVDSVGGTSKALSTDNMRYVKLGKNNGNIVENIISPEPLLELLYTSDEELPELHLDKYIFFDNLFWFYSNDSNVVRWSTEDNPFDISVNNYDEVGDNTPIKDVELIGENALGLFKEKATYSVTGLTVGNIYTYSFTELVNDYGTVSKTGVTLTPISKLPIAVNLEEISGLYATKSIGTVNRYFTSITLGVDKKYKTFNSRKLRAETFKYWNLFIDSDSEHNESKILVRDDRTGDYFYWEVPISIDYCWSHDKQFYMLSIVDNKIYTFYTTDIRGANGNPNTYEYYDNDRQLIKWYYKSQILTLGTINYTKRLINTTFVMSDNDIDGDGYALNFSLTHYKQTPYTDTRPKNVSSDLLKLIQSTTKRTIIPKLKFLQFELTNTTSEYYDNELDNNKFRLVGLAFKYTLLEGLY